MNGLLSGQALCASLRAAGVEINRVSAPKQTDTPQRWKIGLQAQGRCNTPLHTKVEFSRRPTEEEASLEAVFSAVLAHHAMLPVLVRHYPLDAALRQKVGALVGHTVVQARDVFDLGVLLNRADSDAPRALHRIRERLAGAIERVMEVSFDQFQGQVVAYLDPDHADMYASRAAWDALQSQVVDELERAAR
jgi:hypothetical protein